MLQHQGQTKGQPKDREHQEHHQQVDPDATYALRARDSPKVPGPCRFLRMSANESPRRGLKISSVLRAEAHPVPPGIARLPKLVRDEEGKDRTNGDAAEPKPQARDEPPHGVAAANARNSGAPRKNQKLPAGLAFPPALNLSWAEALVQDAPKNWRGGQQQQADGEQVVAQLICEGLEGTQADVARSYREKNKCMLAAFARKARPLNAR